jgi:hypothetical protein
VFDHLLSGLLANTVLILHVGIATFVVGGLVLAILGNLNRWSRVNNFWFRIAHLVAIAVVLAESWSGVACPRTTLEMWLRSHAGASTYGRGVYRALAPTAAVLRRPALGVCACVLSLWLTRLGKLLVLPSEAKTSRS